VLNLEEYPEGFDLSGEAPIKPQTQATAEGQAGASTSAAAGNDSVLGKRKAEDAAESGRSKRLAQEEGGVMVVHSSDEEGGARPSASTRANSIIFMD
jgi:hypothetical protein